MHAIFHRCRPTDDIPMYLNVSLKPEFDKDGKPITEEPDDFISFDPEAVEKNEKSIEFLFGQTQNIYSQQLVQEALVAKKYDDSTWTDRHAFILKLLYLAKAIRSINTDASMNTAAGSDLWIFQETKTLSPNDPNFEKWYKEDYLQSIKAEAARKASADLKYFSAAERDAQTKDLQQELRNAKAGDDKAMLKLAYAYYNGKTGFSESEENKKSFFWLSKSAERGNAEAMLCLGTCYSLGIGVAKEPDKAFEWYCKSARRGNASAMCIVGQQFAIAGQDETALEWYQKSASSGDSDGMRSLAACYHNGWGVEADESKAFYWYKQSAEHGDVRAMYIVGSRFESGLGVSADPDAAFYWYRKSAEKGDLKGTFAVANCYRDGIGTAPDQKKAFDLYMKNAKKRHAESMFEVGECYLNGRGVNPDMEMALGCMSLSVKLGDEKAIPVLKDLWKQVDENVGYVINQDACVGCGNCKEACIFGMVIEGDNGTYKIDTETCASSVECGLCANECPVNAIIPVGIDFYHANKNLFN